MSKRYFLSRDNDSHWYVIPVAKQQEWDAFLDIDPEDERAWDMPFWACPVGGSPTLVTFTDPQVAA